MISPASVIAGVLGFGWIATAVVGAGYYENKLLDQKQTLEAAGVRAVTDMQYAERHQCRVNRDKLVAQINGTADAEVAAGDEAAALVPMLKTREELIELCKQPGSACRTKAEATAPVEATPSLLEPASPPVTEPTPVDPVPDPALIEGIPDPATYDPATATVDINGKE